MVPGPSRNLSDFRKFPHVRQRGEPPPRGEGPRGAGRAGPARETGPCTRTHSVRASQPRSAAVVPSKTLFLYDSNSLSPITHTHRSSHPERIFSACSTTWRVCLLLSFCFFRFPVCCCSCASHHLLLVRILTALKVKSTPAGYSYTLVTFLQVQSIYRKVFVY